MKSLFLKSWMAAALLAGGAFGLVACDDDDNGSTPPPTGPDLTAVVGSYSGTMTVANVAPSAGDGEEQPAGTAVDATVTAEQIRFEDFPIRDLVVKIVGDEELADTIVETVGKIDYAVPYTAQANAEQNAIRLTLAPEPLKLTFPTDGGGQASVLEEPAGIAIEVTISAEGEGEYLLETERLGFALSVAGVTLGGEALEGFEPFSLHFDLGKLSAGHN